MPFETRPEIERNSSELVGLVVKGDRQAVDLLFGFYIPRLRRIATRILPNRSDSEDALQDGLLLAYRHLEQFRGNAQLSSWLHRIVVNSSLASLRKQNSTPAISIDQPSGADETRMEDRVADSGPNPEEQCLTRERLRILSRTIDELPPRSRQVVRLIDIDGLSTDEAARSIGITPSAIKSLHFRARRSMLRKVANIRR